MLSAVFAVVLCVVNTAPAPVAGKVTDWFRRPQCTWCAGNRGLEFAERTLDSLDVAEQLGDIRTERATVRAWWSLVVQRNAPTLRNADLTAVGINFAGDDPQQRCLANPVASDQAHSLACAHA